MSRIERPVRWPLCRLNIRNPVGHLTGHLWLPTSFVLHADPIHLNSGPRAQAFHQFSGVLLKMSDVVDLQFGLVEG